MATQLTKPVHRQVELKDGRYFASLDPCNGEPSFTLRKVRTSSLTKLNMEECLDIKPEPTVRHDRDNGTREQVVNDIKSLITISDIDYKLKVEILGALVDILEVDKLAILEGVNHDK